VQPDEYDLAEAFRRIENELIASMIRNMDRHRAEETKEGYNWSMWQVEQLKALEKYKRKNQKKYQKQFKSINSQIEHLIRQARMKGNMKQEIRILQAIRKGWKTHGRNGTPAHDAMTAEFFKLNDRKLDALIEATTHDMEAAETAVLRKANDDYRKAIFNAQVYANTGAGTYEKAVDMATKDMLSRGLNCVMYANGARHTLSDYADMAIRTASKRAYLQGEGEKRQEWGVATVIMAKRGNPCPKCLPFVGKVLIDDVWSGGSKDGVDPETGKRYPLMSYAISKGLYHPRCKDSHTTYFPGISTADDTWTKEELENVGLQSQQEVRQQYTKRQEEKYSRLAEYSLDPDNKQIYGRKASEWRNVRFKTGNLDASDYIEQKREEQFFGMPDEITDEWTKKNTDGSLIDMKEYDVNGVTYKVDGKRVTLHPTEQERSVAAVLSKKYGKIVEFVPQIMYPQGIQTPDYLINGERFDLKTFKSSGKNVFYNMIAKKKKQSPNFIFDITECPLSAEEIERQINGLYSSHHTRFIEKIVVMKDGKIEKVYMRK
jgi:hypothetical protein